MTRTQPPAGRAAGAPRFPIPGAGPNRERRP